MKRSAYNKPHNKLRFITPDQVAETWDGVDKNLYSALWRKGVKAMRPPNEFEFRSEYLFENSVASLWDKFSKEEKSELNKLCQASN